jgi:type VI secretion system (T6SS) phospholipase Tle1-like effector
MKRIVICYDGTWNALTDPSAVTNVVRVGQAVKATDEQNRSQIVYYNAGVGSGGPIDRFLGGVFGVGVRDNVKRGLAFLTLNWVPGDEIYIFGFSRGAYTARALAGVITAIRGVPRQEYFHRLEHIWNFYRLSPHERHSEATRRKWEIDEMVAEVLRPTPLVKCLAVWDTVGSYGIPAGLGLSGLARKLTSWTRGFHDNMLHPRIEVGLQALAIDELRAAFPPTTWVGDPKEPSQNQHVEQVWFAGVHANVGGGYLRSGLSDLALIWIMARVEALTKLRFSPDYIAKNFWPCAACSLYRSSRGWWWLSSLFPYRRPLFPEPKLIEGWFNGKKEKRNMVPINEKIHWSVIERLGRTAFVDEKLSKTYAPSNLPLGWKRKAWPEEDRAALEQDARVAQMTPQEDALIKACRHRDLNPRFQNCALFCTLDDAAVRAQKPRSLAALRSYFSSADRRVRRLIDLRKLWKMEDAPPY